MPLAGHDLDLIIFSEVMFDISTPMPLAGHDTCPFYSVNNPINISTPMPLAGHDCPPGVWILSPNGNFYSHAPRGA